MEIFPLFVLLMLCSSAHAELFRDFEKRIFEDMKWEVDRSAASICYVVGGTLEEVKPGKPEHGYTCDAELDAPSADKKEAEDMCKSIFPHYILEADKKGERTRCKFIILNRCVPNYFLIYEKCYIVLDAQLTYTEAQKMCTTAQEKKPEAKIAEYTSSNLGLDLLHMDFKDVWVQVPDLNEHFGNDKEEGGAVFIVRNSWKFEAKEGVLKMDDLSATHFPLCEYTPKRTMAGIKWTSGKYNVTGFPQTVSTDGGFSFDASQICAPRDKDCIARIGEWVKQFFGTEVVFDGFICTYGPMPDIVPMVPMKVLCPAGWFQFKRTNGQVICHKVFPVDEKIRCAEHGADLSGFDSKEEVDELVKHFKLNGRFLTGGIIPCSQTGCDDTPKTVRNGVNRYYYQWTNGVANNLEFLYQNLLDGDLKAHRYNAVIKLEAGSISRSGSGRTLWDFVGHGRSTKNDHICSKYADF